MKLLTVAIALAATVAAAAITYACARNKFRKIIKRIEDQKQSLEEDNGSLRVENAGKDVIIKGLAKDVEYLSQMKEANEKVLQERVQAIKAQIIAENEKNMQARQEQIQKQARESFAGITEDFNRQLKDMKDAFESGKKVQSDTAAMLQAQIGAAVKSLEENTRSVADKADNLANALRGQNKMQGCWGETQLNNLLCDEGFIEGRDYDREQTLRDSLGIVIHNEDSGKRMRPDFILHFPDETDIAIDCKVSLAALSDYFSAKTDREREEASLRNLKSVREQIDNLARKDYASYLKPSRKFLDYTIMYIPNVNALTLAKREDASIVSEAFRRNVLITSEETLMPVLRLIRTAWNNYDQARNQEKIVEQATRMIDRVADFCKAYAEVGKKLEEARSAYDKAGSKLREDGQSIIHAAKEVQRLGVKSRKELPE